MRAVLAAARNPAQQFDLIELIVSVGIRHTIQTGPRGRVTVVSEHFEAATV